MAEVFARLLGPGDLRGTRFTVGDFFWKGEKLKGEYKFGIPKALSAQNPNLALVFQRYAPAHGDSALDVSRLQAEANLNQKMKDALRNFSGTKGPWHGSVSLEWFVRFAKEKAPAEDWINRLLARWKQGLERAYPGTRVFQVTLGQRAAVGLATASPWENSGWAFHHVYGLPIIPGDSLKGLARHYLGSLTDQEVQSLWPSTSAHVAGSGLERKSSAELVAVLFGSGGANGQQGRVVIHDALPESNPEGWFDLDVVTTHHQRYYGDRSPTASDADDPVPAHHLCLRPGTQFWVGVSPSAGEGKVAALLEFAVNLLRRSLEDWGAGAKTGVGYGRIQPEDSGT